MNLNINTQKRKVLIGDTEVSWSFIKHLNDMLVSIERTEAPYTPPKDPWNTTLFRGTHNVPCTANYSDETTKAVPRTSNADSMAEAILGDK